MLTNNRIFRDRMDGVGLFTRGGRGRLRPDRAVPARVRRGLRRAQGPPVPGLRPVRVRRPGRHQGRQLRPLPGAPRGDAAVDAHPAPGAATTIPPGPVIIDDPRIALPPKSETYNTIEAMIAHFKLIMDGIRVPARRGLLLRRGRQRRARLLHRVRRHRPAVEVPRAGRPASSTCRPSPQAASRPPHRRHRPDLRHDQHDRRGVRQVAMSAETKPDTSAGATADAKPLAKSVPAVQPSAETVTLTIDGVQVTVPKGTNVLEAARAVGVDVSVVLLPPGPRVAGGVPPVPGRRQGPAQAAAVLLARRWPTRWRCTPPTSSSSTMRQQMLEFTLLNHPIDCPICDKAGECTLQKLYFDWDDNAPRASTASRCDKPRSSTSGPTHRARRRALHPVHPLHPRVRRGGRRAPARDAPPRRPRGC